MKFQLASEQRHFVKPGESEEMEKLKSIGFEFIKTEIWYKIKDNPIEIEINSLEELINISNVTGYELIVDSTTISIYNNYIE